MNRIPFVILEAQRLREVDSMISENPSKNRKTDIEASPAVAKSRIEIEVLKKRIILKAMIMPINVASRQNARRGRTCAEVQ